MIILEEKIIRLKSLLKEAKSVLSEDSWYDDLVYKIDEELK